MSIYKMMNLEQKYRQDRLTPNELNELRAKVNSTSDEMLEEAMCNEWMHDDIDISHVDTQRIDLLKRSIDKEINKKWFVYSKFFKWIQVAAIILLPISIATIWYLYKENNQLSSEEMVVATGIGEHAKITLPDGTDVNLNAESKLCYIPKIYNKKERKIRFDGEGYFQVAKDKQRPFLINAQGLSVKVLGTKFNLSARKRESTAVLSLKEGSVLFSSILTGMNVILRPDQKAILNQSTGIITVKKAENFQDIIAWRRKELVFRNAPLLSVINSIEKNYNIKIRIKTKSYLKDLFTGTLPNSNINEDLEILEKSYHFKAIMTSQEVLIIPNN